MYIIGTIALIGGSVPSEGNVWITNQNGHLGPVCDIGWDKNDADVVCRQLGYEDGGSPTKGLIETCFLLNFLVGKVKNEIMDTKLPF